MQPAATNTAPLLLPLLSCLGVGFPQCAGKSAAAAASILARSLAVVAVSIKLGSAAAAAVIFRGGRKGRHRVACESSL